MVTTYDTKLEACNACIEFYPEREDGLKFHAPIFHDVQGGVWNQVCHAGPCTTRGDIIVVGTSVQQNEEKQCITKVPVPWFSDCDPILHDAMSTVYDVTRFCSYREQMFVPPPPSMLSPWAGVTQAYTRLNPSRETCLATIETQGTALWDDMSFCDSNIKKLSGCCESVHDSFKCMHDVGGAGPKFLLQKDMQGFQEIKDASANAMKLFQEFCVPLCIYSEPEFCEKYPYSDICVSHDNCAVCTRAGGEWCMTTMTCHCPRQHGQEPICPHEEAVYRSPLECLGASTTPMEEASTTIATTTTAPQTTTFPPLPTIECKYLEMVDVWSQEINLPDGADSAE